MTSITGMTTALHLIRSNPNVIRGTDVSAVQTKAIVPGIAVGANSAMRQAATLASSLSHTPSQPEPAPPAQVDGVSAPESAQAAWWPASQATSISELPVSQRPLSLFGLSGELKAVYNEIPRRIAAEKALLKHAADMLPQTADPVQRQRFESILQSGIGKLSAEEADRIASVQSRFEKFSDYYKTNYIVTEEISKLAANGRVKLGVFEVYVINTGEFYFGRNSEGIIRQWDPVLGRMHTQRS